VLTPGRYVGTEAVEDDGEPLAQKMARLVARRFIPALLPPGPPVALGEPLRTHLSQADYALGRLDGAVLTLPNPDLFVFMCVRKEAVLSSQIEGTQSSSQTCWLLKRASPTRTRLPMSARSSTTFGP
jgi:Fic family protein